MEDQSLKESVSPSPSEPTTASVKAEAGADHLTPEEASRIIYSHRKVRYGTACWPCRQRKVKCDNEHPCENCVKRDHPQLCSYKPNRTRFGSGNLDSAQGQRSRKRLHSPDSGTADQSVDGSGGWPRANDGGEPVEFSRYMGQNSIPALLREQSSPNDSQEGTIRNGVSSLLGLDNSAPFPLMSTRHLDRMTNEISTELPSDREVMKLFRTYKEIPQPFWNFVMDIDDLEHQIVVYLEERAKRNSKDPTASARPVSASWLAILFAVLAVGAQYHESPYHIRTRDSQKYIQISFHFLRLGNFLLRPTFDSIQALLLICFVLLNDMKAEASWALLGMTCRLAQSLGLHRCLPAELATDPKKAMTRRKLWWTCVWHDTLTSLSFDRPPMTNMINCPLPVTETSNEGWTYIEAMYQLCQIISQRLNPDAAASATYYQILDNCSSVEAIRENVVPQLRVKENCKTLTDRLQHFAIRLHTSFVVSVCLRPALRRSSPDTNEPNPGSRPLLDAKQKAELAQRCKFNLAETVRMFLAIHQLSIIPTRSWAFTYHGLSSAVLLGILSESKADPTIRRLQGDLIDALSATAAKDQTSPKPGQAGSHIRKSDRDIELSGPLSRALTALKNIYDHGHVAGPKRDLTDAATTTRSGTASGARTPLHPLLAASAFAGTTTPTIHAHQAAAASSAGQLQSPYPPIQSGVDPHQDAALAMAEMQQTGGNLLQPGGAGDYSMQYATTAGGEATPTTGVTSGLSLADMAALDAGNATSMSPLDVYDSIFWEAPDLWTGNPGGAGAALDSSMPYDFNPQAAMGQSQQFYF